MLHTFVSLVDDKPGVLTRVASLYKLEITRDVDELGRSEAVIRELCLIKVAAGPNSPHGQHSRSQIFELANVFRARVVDLAPESIMLEMTGAASKIEGLLQVLRESSFEVLEVSRTGRMAMRRGHHTSRVLKALGTPNGEKPEPSFPNRPQDDDLPNQFEEDNA